LYIYFGFTNHEETTVSSDALPVVRRYHESWTNGEYNEAIGLLAPALEVEVPINEYPTASAFAQALRRFGERVTRVHLLSEMSEGNEVTLLYDMEVQQVGQLRVAEHFTIVDGRIVRLRQIHDTAPVRAAGLDQATAAPGPPISTGASDDYVRELVFTSARERIVEGLVTLEGLAGWWTTAVSGNPGPGGDLEFIFDRHNQKVVLHVDEVTDPSRVVWSCDMHTGHPEWEGTRIVFELIADGEEGGTLRFRHLGLTPALECYESCERGWDYFLASLLSYAQDGAGTPY
jgi:ketosteroid isomerase-like protein